MILTKNLEAEQETTIRHTEQDATNENFCNIRLVEMWGLYVIKELHPNIVRV